MALLPRLLWRYSDSFHLRMAPKLSWPSGFITYYWSTIHHLFIQPISFPDSHSKLPQVHPHCSSAYKRWAHTRPPDFSQLSGLPCQVMPCHFPAPSLDFWWYRSATRFSSPLARDESYWKSGTPTALRCYLTYCFIQSQTLGPIRSLVFPLTGSIPFEIL